MSGFCENCPDHEGCMGGIPCDVVKRAHYGDGCDVTDPENGPDEEGIRFAKAIGWEVGYQRGALDSEGDLERAANPYLDDSSARQEDCELLEERLGAVETAVLRFEIDRGASIGAATIRPHGDLLKALEGR